MAIEIIRGLADRGIRIKSLTEPFLDVDTSTPMGEAIIGIMAVMAQLRVSTIRENTVKGLAHARSHGRVGGRPSVMNFERFQTVQRLRLEGFSYPRISKTLGVSISTIRHALNGQQTQD